MDALGFHSATCPERRSKHATIVTLEMDRIKVERYTLTLMARRLRIACLLLDYSYQAGL